MLIGMIVFGLALILGADILLRNVNRITIHGILYVFDYRFWQIGLGYACWLLPIWLVFDAVFRRGEREFTRIFVSVMHGLFGVAFCLVLGYTAYTYPGFGRRFYDEVLLGCFFTPMSLFFYDGTLTPRLAVPPLTAVTGIAFLLFLNARFKRKTPHADNEEQ